MLLDLIWIGNTLVERDLVIVIAVGILVLIASGLASIGGSK